MPKPENIVPHQYKPGQTGNPNGRPRMPDIKEALIKILNDEKDGWTALEAILAALRKKALKGDVRAAQELLDRAYGKSTQIIETTTKDPLQIKIVKSGRAGNK